MISEIRRKRILEILRRDNNVVTKELGKIFNVSPMTIRRDLKQLEGLGYVKRTYKGAIIEELGTELSFMDKILKCREEKERIAKKAVEYIQESDFIALTGGSTTFQLALSLIESDITDLTILTNSINIAAKLIDRKGFHVIVAGGPIREKSYECVGESVLETINQYNIGKFFLGVNGLSIRGGISMSNIEESTVARAALKRSLMNIVIADNTKVGHNRMGHICEISDIDLLIMNKEVPEKFKKELERVGVKVRLV